MAYTTIDDPSAYFQTATYTGNGGTLAVVNTGNSDLQPDMLWGKDRGNATNHELHDSVRGATKRIKPNDVDDEQTQSNSVTSFDSDGFSLGSDGDLNGNNGTFVAWQWKETATAGFDIVAYTGNGSNRTISHSCGAIPKMIIIKDLNADDNWNVYTAPTGNDSHMHLNLTNATSGSSSYWNDTTPTSSVFSLGSNGAVNENANNFIAYCFADVQGFSKVGTYTGNGNANGAFVYTGFKPAFLMIKCTDAARSWQIHNSKSSPFNTGNTNARLFANLVDAEAANSSLDLLSNGFKVRESSDLNTNGSGNNYIYMAFAEAPLVGSNNTPCTAR